MSDLNNPITALSREELELEVKAIRDAGADLISPKMGIYLDAMESLLAVMDVKPIGYFRNDARAVFRVWLTKSDECNVPVYTTPPAPSAPDYFGELVSKARHSAEKAMIKFPQPNYVLLKVAEEAGEVVQAGVHYAEGRETWEALEGEVVQTVAMLYRLVTEGDQVNGVIPPAAPGVD